MSENPFEVLRLAPSSSEAEIVRQAGRLRQRATDEATRNAIRQAVQALTGRVEERLLWALRTHTSPCHHDPTLERFAATFRRPPVADTPLPIPSLDRNEVLKLIKELAAEELILSPLPFEPVSEVEEAHEIDRQTAEVMWQALLFTLGERPAQPVSSRQ